MITPQLVLYIKKQLANNISKELINEKLLKIGWHQEDIDDGFYNVNLEVKSEIHISNLNNELEQNIDIKKVWTPTTIPVLDKPTIKIEKTPTKDENHNITTQNLEIEAHRDIVLENKSDNKKENGGNNLLDLVKQESLNKHVEFIPTLTPKPENDPLFMVNKVNLINKESSIGKLENPINNNLPKMAMLSSFNDDLQKVIKTDIVVPVKSHKKLIRWFIFIFIIILIASGVFLANLTGLINLKKINIPLIKKEPKTLLLDNSHFLSSIKSYKIDTSISVTSPALSNISASLIKGENVSSLEIDSLSVYSFTKINNESNGVSFENLLNIKSSLLSDEIIATIKNNKDDLSVSIVNPNLVIKEVEDKPVTLDLKKSEFEYISELFFGNKYKLVNNVDVYNILYSSILSYINKNDLEFYNNFVEQVKFIEKNEEKIKGINTYHYAVSADSELYKKLFTKVYESVFVSLDDNDKSKIDNVIGSISVDTFDIWVGKGDNNIYQYNMIFSIPLSQILSFEDKSIGDSKLEINWKSTYYDFDITNEITPPTKTTSLNDFINMINRVKMKNGVSSFVELSRNLFKKENSYGKVSNLSGSCVNPSSGSLFSPLGHLKTSMNEISEISLLLNKILKVTNNNGYCYSSPTAWSFSVPMIDNYDPTGIPTISSNLYFCIDSKGQAVELENPQKGLVCK